MPAHLMHHRCFITVILLHIILYKSVITPGSVVDQCLTLSLLLLIFIHKSNCCIISYAANSLFFHLHMGSLRRFPSFHPSLSLPSIHHLRSPDSPVHRHLIPPPLKSRRASAPHPLPEEPLTELKVETLNTGPHPPISNHAHPIVDKDARKLCSLCHNLIPDHIGPCTFPETAPAAVAALSPHIPVLTGPRIFCYSCWVWIHNLSICWTCGDTVSRKEERVSYGWCWWHWGCVSCLFCRVCRYVSRSHFPDLELLIFAFDLTRNMGRISFLKLFWHRIQKRIEEN